jgi:FkbM family methyltransferase
MTSGVASSSRPSTADREDRAAEQSWRKVTEQGRRMGKDFSSKSNKSKFVRGSQMKTGAIKSRAVHDDDYLKFQGNYIIRLTSNGTFDIRENIHSVWLDIGVLDITDFVDELKRDPHLLVIGIDANPEMMRRQRFKHPHFRLFNFAAGEERKYIEFNVHDHAGCSSVLESNTEFDLNTSSRPHVRNNGQFLDMCTHKHHSVTVPMVKLDDFMARIPSHLPIGWVKIDVQGYDFMVMKSIGSQASRVSKFQFETQILDKDSPLNLYKGRASFSEVEEWILNQGFPKPLCSSNNDAQKRLGEVDCVTCRYVKSVTPQNCFRKH